MLLRPRQLSTCKITWKLRANYVKNDFVALYISFPFLPFSKLTIPVERISWARKGILRARWRNIMFTGLKHYFSGGHALPNSNASKRWKIWPSFNPAPNQLLSNGNISGAKARAFKKFTKLTHTAIMHTAIDHNFYCQIYVWQHQKWWPTRKLSYRKDDRAMRSVYECPENFLQSLTMPRLFLSTFLHAFLPTDVINMRTKFEVCSFNSSWDSRVPQNFEVTGYAHGLFSPKFLMGFWSGEPVNVPTKFDVYSFTCS